MIARIAALESQVAELKHMIERVLAHHERTLPAPSATGPGVSIGGAAHGQPAIHDYLAHHFLMFMPHD